MQRRLTHSVLALKRSEPPLTRVTVASMSCRCMLTDRHGHVVTIEADVERDQPLGRGWPYQPIRWYRYAVQCMLYAFVYVMFV